MRLIVLAFVVASSCLGCSKSKEPAKVKVSGTVSLDKQDMAKGNVQFNKPGEPPITADVINGKFEVSIVPGSYRVEIYAYRPAKPDPTAPKDGPGGAADAEENYVADAYNINSKLTADIKEGENPPLKFEVISKK